MSISADFFPNLYRLCDRAELPRGLIPFGCTWQHPIGLDEHAERAAYPEVPREVLERIVAETGAIAVRDHLAARVLRRNGLPAVVVGDCGWYHLPSINQPMRRARAVTRIVVTAPHRAGLAGQSMALMDALRQRLRMAEIILSLHSRRKRHDHMIAQHAGSRGIEVVDAAGDLSIFTRYAGFDLHVGHRLHGHIGFLRRRIPSVLLMEDVRSRGFSRSIPVGTFRAFRHAVSGRALAQLPNDQAILQMEADPVAVERIVEFLDDEVTTGFLRYVGVAPYLDQMLHEVVLPELRRKTAMAAAAIDRGW